LKVTKPEKKMRRRRGQTEFEPNETGWGFVVGTEDGDGWQRSDREIVVCVDDTATGVGAGSGALSFLDGVRMREGVGSVVDEGGWSVVEGFGETDDKRRIGVVREEVLELVMLGYERVGVPT
jgi:hypothetical protein